MKTTYFIFGLLSLLSSISLSQQLIPEALTPTERDEFDNPITNVIDINSARQGEWIYQDIYGKPFQKEIYVDHILQSVYISTINEDGIVDWKMSTNWVQNEGLTKEILKIIVDKYGPLQDDEQIAILISANNELVRFAPLGNMNETKSKKIEKTIQEFLNNLSITFITDETLILI